MGNKSSTSSKGEMRKPGPKSRTSSAARGKSSSPELASSTHDDNSPPKKKFKSTQSKDAVSNKPGPASRKNVKILNKTSNLSKGSSTVSIPDKKSPKPGPKSRRKQQRESEDDDEPIVLSDDEDQPMDTSKKGAKGSKKSNHPVPSTPVSKSSKKKVSLSPTSSPSKSGALVSPASSSLTSSIFGSLKIKAMSKAGMKSVNPKTSRVRNKKPAVVVPPKEQPERILTKTGPRATGYKDLDKYYALEAILDKWYGTTDKKSKDSFYLVQWKGHDVPDKKDEALWLHKSQFTDCDQLMAAADAAYQLKVDTRTKKKQRPGWIMVSEDEDEEQEEREKKRKSMFEPLASIEVAGKSLRVRQEKKDLNENVSDNGSIHGSPEKKENKRKRSQKTIPYSDDIKTGFDKGWTPVKIHHATIENQQLVYFVQFKESKTVEGILSTEVKKKIPEMLLNFLLPKMSGVPRYSLPDAQLLNDGHNDDVDEDQENHPEDRERSEHDSVTGVLNELLADDD